MTDIAIIGMGCRFPMAPDIHSFWQLLKNAKDAISEVNTERYGFSAITDNLKRGGFIDAYDQFDANFFGISSREAKYMDPQQRILLEVTWNALEDAYIIPQKLTRTNTGVFVGVMGSEWARLTLNDKDTIEVQSGTGNGYCMLANRLSYLYNLRGPSLAVDTACSSSLVAMDIASKYLHSKEIDTAIVAGVNLMLTPALSVFYQKAGLASKDGRCKPFGSAADGIVRGEGVGVVVLKRLADAVLANDKIYAVVKAVAVNQDGLSNGLTAPNRWAQIEVIKSALEKSGKTADDLQYIEAHGTGTLLGDPIEAAALNEVIGKERSSDCLIGSVKGNIGHLEGAAGIAGVIKAALALHYKQIPPSLNFGSGNAYINFKDNKIKVPTQLIHWNNSNRCAGISSFGLGGTNAHMIMDSYESNPSSLANKKVQVLKLSAKTPDSLIDLIQSYLHLESNESLTAICGTANKYRSDFDYRVAVVAKDQAELKNKLSQELAKAIKHQRSSAEAALVFLDNPPMLDLLNELPELKAFADKFLDTNKKSTNLILQFAWAKMLLALGIIPKALIGYGDGAYIAKAIAFGHSLEEMLQAFDDKQLDLSSLQKEQKYDLLLIHKNIQSTRKSPQLQYKKLNEACIHEVYQNTTIRQLIQIGAPDPDVMKFVTDAEITNIDTAEAFYELIAHTYQQGGMINWDIVYPNALQANLPLYPFKRETQTLEYLANKLDIKTSITAAMQDQSTLDLRKVVLELAAQISEIPLAKINEQSDIMTDLGFDSMMVVDFKSQLEKTLRIDGKLELRNIITLTTVGEFINHVNKIITEESGNV